MKVRDRIVSWATLLCFVAGAALGLLRPDWAGKLSFLGTAYVTVLKYLALPMLILSVFHAALLGGKNAAGTLIRALALFVLLFIVTFLLSALLYTLIAPGRRFSFVQEVAWEGNRVNVTLAGFLENTFSPSKLTSINSLFFPLILISFALGLVCGVLKARFLEKGTEAAMGFFQTLLSWVMLLMPLGVLSLMAQFTSTFGLEALKTSGAYILWAYAGCLLALFAVMILPLWITCKIDPIQYFQRTGRTLLTALSTCSSAATLPETMRACREEFGVAERIVGIVTPLGCTVHMCGGAVSFSLLAFYSYQVMGYNISLGTLLWMLALALLLNMGAPGIPGGGIVLGATYLGMMGFIHWELFLGMYAGIYRVLDMAYTSLNVAGDVTANILIDRWEKKA